MATSLLIDPASDLNIMVTATIQADLKSDNFLVVCTALQAISQCHGVELVSVFLPQVLAALRHDRDLVKKKALLALHRLLQLDPSISPDVERHLVEKLGYKEPSVMVAALCGLYQLAKSDPAPYRNLVHYFTNILKQVSEGRLGRAWDYHRAPAPFVQIQLLRLLALLGAGDMEATQNMQAVILDVWRRADALASTVGVVLVYECMRTATALVPTDALLGAALDSMPRFLPASENNLKYAGIDVLSRLVAGDAGRVQQYQLAIVDCLRSPDVTLKRKTLRLLFMMAGPNNIETIATEVLSYLKDPQGDDGEARTAAASSLFDVMQKYSPSPAWFADTTTTLLECAGDVAPLKVGEALLSVAANVDQSMSQSAATDLRRSLAKRYLKLLDKPKLYPALLRVACLIVGEYGLLTGTDYETVAETLAGVPETQAVDAAVLAAVALALGKLCLRAKRPLPEQASTALHSLMASESIQVQQVAVEANALVNGPPTAQKAVLEASKYIHSFNGDSSAKLLSVKVDPSLPFLDGYVHDAELNGAPPYLSLDDRIAMGLTRDGRSGQARSGVVNPLDSSTKGGGNGATTTSAQLKFTAYAAASPTPSPPAIVPLHEQTSLANQPQSRNTTTKKNSSTASQGHQQLNVPTKAQRKWGPKAEATVVETASSGNNQYLHTNVGNVPSSTASDSNRMQKKTISPVSRHAAAKSEAEASVDPAKQRLAASLFGGGGQGARKPSALAERDLLGDYEDAAAVKKESSNQTVESSLLDFGGGIEPRKEVERVIQDDPMAALVGLDFPASYPNPALNVEDSLLPEMPIPHQPGPSTLIYHDEQQKNSHEKDPFASLLD